MKKKYQCLFDVTIGEETFLMVGLCVCRKNLETGYGNGSMATDEINVRQKICKIKGKKEIFWNSECEIVNTKFHQGLA